METVTLKPDIAEQLKHLADSDEFGPDTDVIVDRALRVYLTNLRQKKIEAESHAFEQQKDALAKYNGEYVAIHNGQIVDHDSDLRTLHLRVFKQFGHKPVLLKQVISKPERELTFRSPKFESGP